MCSGAQSSYGSFACRALYLDSYFLQVTQKGTLDESFFLFIWLIFYQIFFMPNNEELEILQLPFFWKK